MSTPETSLERAVVDEVGAGGIVGAAATADQIDLALDEARADGSNVFRLLRQREQATQRGPGRPKGARNKASDDIAKLLAHKGIKDPVLYMAEIYNTPLDQLCALALHADGTIERQARIDGLIEQAVEQMAGLTKRLKITGELVTDNHVDAAKELQRATDRLVELSAQRATKPGDVAIKLINAQLSAAKAVAEYVRAKLPTQHKVEIENLPTIVMPGVGSAQDVEAADQTTRLASDLLAKALANGQLTPASLNGLELRDGQLMIEGECVEVERGADE